MSSTMPFRRTSFLLVVLGLLGIALVVVGCGGNEPAPSTTAVRPTPSGGAGATEAGSNPMLGESVRPTDQTPSEFVEANGVRPIVVLFYIPSNADDISVYDSLRRLTPAFPNYVFLVYDYKKPQAYGDLSTLLRVGYPPQLFMIDKSGVVREVWSGYIDEGSLNQKLVDLGRY